MLQGDQHTDSYGSFLLDFTYFWNFFYVQSLRYPIFFLEISFFILAFHLTIKGNLKTGPSITAHPTHAKPNGNYINSS